MSRTLHDHGFTGFSVSAATSMSSRDSTSALRLQSSHRASLPLVACWRVFCPVHADAFSPRGPAARFRASLHRLPCCTGVPGNRTPCHGLSERVASGAPPRLARVVSPRCFPIAHLALRDGGKTQQEQHIMKSEDASKLATSALEKLAQVLQAGHSEALTASLAGAGRFHAYSFRNVMLIASQRPDATRVAGVNAWRKLGRFVKKREKGIIIIAPIVFKRDEQAADSDNGRADAVQRRFKSAFDFDVS